MTTKPTHTLCMKTRNETRDKWVPVGAGWEHDGKKWITISLNRGITLTWRDMEDMKLALFEAYKK